MGTSYVNIGDSGFWMRDSVLELWLRLLALHLPEPEDATPVEERELLFETRNTWLLQSKGYFNGCVSVDLERFAASDPGKSSVLSAITVLEKQLNNTADRLDKSTLNLLGCDGVEYFEDFETDKLIQVAKAFRDLIEGRIVSDNHDCAFMPGSKPIDPMKEK